MCQGATSRAPSFRGRRSVAASCRLSTLRSLWTDGYPNPAWAAERDAHDTRSPVHGSRLPRHHRVGPTARGDIDVLARVLEWRRDDGLCERAGADRARGATSLIGPSGGETNPSTALSARLIGRWRSGRIVATLGPARLRRASGAIYPRGLIDPLGNCPWPGPWIRTYGAHLLS
jgi:hypothetical protein